MNARFEPTGCELLRGLLRLFDCRGQSPTQVVVVGFGRPLDPDDPNPTELEIMAIGNIGQRIPLVARFLQADGTTPAVVDGPPVWSTDDPAGVRELTAVGLVVVNDPATEAQTVELDLGPAEDVPAEPIAA